MSVFVLIVKTFMSLHREDSPEKKLKKHKQSLLKKREHLMFSWDDAFSDYENGNKEKVETLRLLALQLNIVDKDICNLK